MLKLLIALTGILFGLVLTWIAPEELKPGRKYFLLANKVLFWGIVFTVLFFSFKTNLILLITIFIIAAALFVIKLKKNSQLLEIPTYLIFIAPYFIIAEQTFQLILASLLFLYGLLVGTLFRTR